MESIQKVADIMVGENILSEFGRKVLRNDIVSDLELTDKSQEVLVRICLYYTIVFNMTMLFGGWTKGNYKEEFQELCEVAITFQKQLPNYLSHLTLEYLEKYHSFKTAIFTKNIFELHQELPPHPNEQPFHDIMKTATEALK